MEGVGGERGRGGGEGMGGSWRERGRDCVFLLPHRRLGQISCLLLFLFHGGVKIARSLRADVTNTVVDTLGPSSTYRKGRGSRWRGAPHNIVPGEKPLRSVMISHDIM